MAVIKEIAEASGVSVGTVSKYLKDPVSVSEKNRIRISAEISAKNYVPDLIARSLRTGRTGIIAVVVPDIANPFFAEVFDALRREALKKGLATVLFTTDEKSAALQSMAEKMILRIADGLVICFSEDESEQTTLAGSVDPSMPVVALTMGNTAQKRSGIIVDVSGGMEMITGYLFNKDRKRIGYISGPSYTAISASKLQGYRNALEKRGAAFDPGLVCECAYRPEGGYECAKKLFSTATPPDAIVCANDIIAIGCLRFAAASGIAVPKTLAVTGFDDISFASMTDPALTSVRIPVNLLADKSITLLEHMRDGSSIISAEYVSLEIVGRDSA